MSNRPDDARSRAHAREIEKASEPGKKSGEHAILPPAPLVPRVTSSGEYRVIRPASRPEEEKLELEVSAVEREVPRGEARLCDTVRVAGAEGEGTIHLVDGEVAWVETRGFEVVSFRARLIHKGLLEQHELDLVLALCRSAKLNFAEMLIQLELVKEEALLEVMRLHVRESMRALLGMNEVTGSWKRGTLSFTGDLTVPLEDVLNHEEHHRWGQIVAHAGGSLTDRRTDERLPVNAIANVETVRGHVLMMTENVSRTGALLRTPCIVEVGSPVIVRFTIGASKLELRGKVSRFRRCSTSFPQAIGISWNIGEEARTALESALSAM